MSDKKRRKILIIGGNRFVGLRLSLLLEKLGSCEIHILNRTGQAPHCRTAIVHKGDRRYLNQTAVDHEYDAIFDFAGFNELDAKSAVQHFTKVGRYIFISTLSVYDLGAGLKESDFDPLVPLPAGKPDPSLAYQDGKRRAEAVFHSQSVFPAVSVRFPVILGEDDYTDRLEFHVHRVELGEDIYLPNPTARISMVDSQDAAEFLLWCLDQDFTGPVNVASPEPIQIQELIAQIEKVTGESMVKGKEEDEAAASPYGPKSDYYLDVSRMIELGFKTRKIAAWLPRLIASRVSTKNTESVH